MTQPTSRSAHRPTDCARASTTAPLRSVRRRPTASRGLLPRCRANTGVRRHNLGVRARSAVQSQGRERVLQSGSFFFRARPDVVDGRFDSGTVCSSVSVSSVLRECTACRTGSVSIVLRIVELGKHDCGVEGNLQLDALRPGGVPHVTTSMNPVSFSAVTARTAGAPRRRRFDGRMGQQRSARAFGDDIPTGRLDKITMSVEWKARPAIQSRYWATAAARKRACGVRGTSLI